MRLGAGFAAIVGLTLSLGCGDSAGPGAGGSSFFTVTLDGAPWVPDTATGVLFGTSPDSGTLNLFAVRQVPGQAQTVAISIGEFPRTGNLVVADTGAPAVGLFTITYTGLPGLSPPTDIYWSNSAFPGVLRITSLSIADSLVAGTFSFQAALRPDTAAHRTLTGQFRVRYMFQQIYTAEQSSGRGPKKPA